MSLASVEMIKESIEKIVRYVDDPDGGPVVRLPTILICVVTIGKSYVQMNSRKEFLSIISDNWNMKINMKGNADLCIQK